MRFAHFSHVWPEAGALEGLSAVQICDKIRRYRVRRR